MHRLQVKRLLSITSRLSFVALVALATMAPTKVREGAQTEGALPTAQGGAPAGGTTGQALKKSSNSDYDYDWGDVSITTGNLTDVGTDGILITGGTGAVVGSGTSIAQHVSDSTHNGYLSSVDWIRFDAAVSSAGVSSWNGRTGAVVPLSNDYTFNQLDFTGSNLTSLEARSYNDLQDLPVLFFGNHLISGGGVAWTGTGYNYIVSACSYVINGVSYTSLETPVTLSASDPTQDRIDVFAVDDTGSAIVIEGTPGGPPLEPTIDPSTQLRLTAAYVPAGSTEPVATVEDIYLENTEWTMSAVGGTINVASTNNPYAGTKDIEGTATTKGDYFTAVKPSGTITLSDFDSLVFFIRSKGLWPNAKSLSIYWLSGSTVVGTAVALTNGSFGFDSSNTTTYQQIVIPTFLFNPGLLTVDRLRVQVAGGASSIGWYIDNIKLQSGGGGGGGGSGGDFSTNTNTSVEDEIVLFADTTGKLGKRSTGTGFAKLTSGVLSTTSLLSTIGFTNDGSGTTVTTGNKGYFTIHHSGTITGWSIAATGSSPTCTIDVWKIATGTALPTVTNTITASAKPALATGNAIKSTTLTGWTTSVSNGDIFGFNVDAVSNATRITFELEVTK